MFFCYNLNFFKKSHAQLHVQRLQPLLKESREYILAPKAQCVAPENIHNPPTDPLKALRIPWGWRVLKGPKILSKCMKLDWNFQRGGGSKE